MTTDSSQVMQVLDRCLDVAGTDSNAAPKVAAAAARAKADPDMHDAISVLLAEEPGTTTWECWRRALAVARQAEPGDNLALYCGECHDSVSPVRQVFSSCQAASGVAGEPDAVVAVTLAQLFLAAIMVERSSLGDDRSRQLRNAAAHGAVAAAVYSWRSLAAHGPETRRPRRPR
jgi:hypothetical protein